jgi:hypothetical protein
VASKKIDTAKDITANLMTGPQSVAVRRANVGEEFKGFSACHGALPIA